MIAGYLRAAGYQLSFTNHHLPFYRLVLTTVLACSKMGLPVSTTHTLVGAILGVGMARGITAINRKIVGSIFTSWLATIPVAAGLTVLFYLIAKWLFW